MRRLVLVHVACWLGVALPSAAQAQTAPPTPAVADSPQAPTVASSNSPPAASPADSSPAVVSADSQPRLAAASADSPVTADAKTSGLSSAIQAAPGAAPEARSLFEPTWHQFQIGGRFSNISGDPARFQRYQDLTNGVLFTDARYAREDQGGNWLFRGTADNVGYRDQRYTASYERTGRFVISGRWDEIPQFYSVDTKTPYTSSGSPLLLDNATQLLIQQGKANLSAWIPLAPQFDLRERRDIGSVSLVATPTPELDVKASFTTTKHSGELPWGGTFGFGNDAEVALPYDSRTNDLTIGTEWMKGRNMLRVAYNGSWFNNLADTLVWDNPLRLTDSASSGPAAGRMALWPTNSAQTVSAAGYSKFQHHTQLTGFISYGFWNNDQPLLPFTTNTALPQIPLPRATAQVSAHIFSTNLNLVTHPKTDWQLAARFRDYKYDNKSPSTSITQQVSYDTSVGTTATGGPDLFAHNRATFDADATWSGFHPFALTAGYTFNHTDYNARIFDTTGEHVLRLAADAAGTQWMNFHAKYEFSDRTGSGLDTNLLTEIGEYADMRHYDLANRTRNQFTGIIDFVPNDLWTFSVSSGLGKDNYPDSYFGLQQTNFYTVSFGADYRLPNGLGGGGNYNFERYSGLQRSRSASPGPQQADPNRDWTTDTAETVNYFSIYITPPRFGPKTEARLSYDFSYAEGSYLYTVVPGGPLPPPSQLPNVYNKLQQLHLDVRHRLTPRLALALSYLYEPFRVYDFAFDPTVVNSIVQPSSLVLGYVYRPYTANSFVISLRYFQ